VVGAEGIEDPQSHASHSSRVMHHHHRNRLEAEKNSPGRAMRANGPASPGCQLTDGDGAVEVLRGVCFDAFLKRECGPSSSLAGWWGHGGVGRAGPDLVGGVSVVEIGGQCG